MNDLAPILICGIFMWGVYRIFELYARRKERMAIIEKLGEQIKLSDPNVDLNNLPFFQKPNITSNSNWALRISLLLIGVGIGVLVGYGIQFSIVSGDWETYYSNNHQIYQFRNMIESMQYACVAVFGGIGLLVAYFIERKQKN